MKRRLFYITIGLLLCSPLRLISQQAPIFTQYYSTYMFSNPAFAGMSEGINVNGLMRQQWAGGFKDADGNVMSPVDYMLSVDSPVKILHGGVGGSILSDKIGYWSDIILQLDYSFHMDLSFGTLGLGAGVSFINRTIDFSKYDPVVEDPILPKNSQSDMRVDASAGIFLSLPEKYYFGLSVGNFINTAFNKFTPDGEEIVKADRTYYLEGGYIFSFANSPKIKITPSFMILNNSVSTQYNLSGIVTYNDRFWGGLNYRFQESVDFIVGMNIKDITIGFSYDVTTMGLGIPGSFEVGLGYNFKIKGDKSKTTYKNTRYL